MTIIEHIETTKWQIIKVCELICPDRHGHGFVMDPPDDEGTLHQTVEAVALNHGPPPDTSSGPKDTQPADMLRFIIDKSRLHTSV